MARRAAALDPNADPLSPATRSRIAAVRGFQGSIASADATAMVFARVRSQLDSAHMLATRGQVAAASGTAFDAYMTFEQVENAVRVKNTSLADQLEASFAAYRTRAAGGATAQELKGIQAHLMADLENAERVVGDELSPFNLFLQSLVILVREGLEAILVIGAVMAFLIKTGNVQRKRDIHVGIGAAVLASLLTAVALETIFQISPASREALEGVTMMVATAMLFYVSYWLLSKMEVAKWNRFVRGRVQDAVTSGSALALASVAFLAVYREGFETVLFYKALFLTGGAHPFHRAGILLASVILVAAHVGINRGRRADSSLAVLRLHQRVPLLHGIRLCGEGNRGASGGRVGGYDDRAVGATGSGAGHLSDRRVPAASECAGSPAHCRSGLDLHHRAAPPPDDERHGAGAEAGVGAARDPGRTVAGGSRHAALPRAHGRRPGGVAGGSRAAEAATGLPQLPPLGGLGAGLGKVGPRIRRGAVAELRDQ
jgi:high-affinity Fe2+/Pb2+ permease